MSQANQTHDFSSERIDAAKLRVNQLLSVTSSALNRLRALDVFVKTISSNIREGAQTVTVTVAALNVFEDSITQMGTELSTLRDYYAKQIDGMESMAELTDTMKTTAQMQARAGATAGISNIPNTPPKAPLVTPNPPTRMLRRPPAPGSQQPITDFPERLTEQVERSNREPVVEPAPLPTRPPVSLSSLAGKKPPVRDAEPTAMVQDHAPMTPYVMMDSQEHSPLIQQLNLYNENKPSLFSNFAHYDRDLGLMEISEWVYLKEGFYSNPENPDICNAIIRFDDICINWYIANNIVRVFHMALNRSETEPEGFRHSWPTHRMLSNTYIASVVDVLNARISAVTA